MRHETSLIATIAIGLSAASVGELIAARLHLPRIVGCSRAGVAAGPFTPDFGALLSITINPLLFRSVGAMEAWGASAAGSRRPGRGPKSQNALAARRTLVVKGEPSQRLDLFGCIDLCVRGREHLVPLLIDLCLPGVASVLVAPRKENRNQDHHRQSDCD
jgi:hypothetical protein